MPGCSGVTVVTNSYAFYHCIRGCGRIARPVFPAPSFQREPDQRANLEQKRAARSRTFAPTSLRAKRSNPAFFLAAPKLDCFVASLLAMTAIRRFALRNDGSGCLKFESGSQGRQ
jgi:hypothetical protein